MGEYMSKYISHIPVVGIHTNRGKKHFSKEQARYDEYGNAIIKPGEFSLLDKLLSLPIGEFSDAFKGSKYDRQ